MSRYKVVIRYPNGKMVVRRRLAESAQALFVDTYLEVCDETKDVKISNAKQQL